MKRRLRWLCRTVNAIDALPVYGQVMKRNARAFSRVPGTAWSTGRPGRKKVRPIADEERPMAGRMRT